MANSLLKQFLLDYIDYIIPFVIIYYIISYLLTKRQNYLKKAKESEENKLIETEFISSDHDFKLQGNREEHCTCTPFLECKEGVPFNGHQLKFEGGIDKFYEMMKARRSVRHYDKTKTIPYETIKKCILSAATSPSGVHTQPWTFCVVTDSEIKQKIREIIEAEEYLNYKKRMSCQWVTDLKPLNINYIKQYLTDVPYLILVFKSSHSQRDDGKRKQHYYNEISVGVACGILLSSFQACGLSSILTRPCCCGPALRTLLNRPESEKLVFVVPVGHAIENCKVPDLVRKTADQIIVNY